MLLHQRIARASFSGRRRVAGSRGVTLYDRYRLGCDWPVAGTAIGPESAILSVTEPDAESGESHGELGVRRSV